MEFHFYPDYASVVAAFDAQEIDGLSSILPPDIQGTAARDDVQLFSSVESGYENVLLNVANPNAPFFQDRSVRQGLLHAIDRDALIRDALAGQGIVANSLFSPEHWAYSDTVAVYSYNPAQAAQLFDAAGWVDSDGDGVRDKDGKPFAFILLVPLAITSTKRMVRRLGGRRWNLLHRLVYLSAIAASVHYYLLVRADKLLPLAFATTLFLLLLWRGRDWSRRIGQP